MAMSPLHRFVASGLALATVAAMLVAGQGPLRCVAVVVAGDGSGEVIAGVVKQGTRVITCR